MRPAPTVVKLGGSHAFCEHLAGWVAAIAGCAGDVVVVPGGGPFADAVREAQPRIGFDDDAAHHMALLAMEQYGCALASLNGTLVCADSDDAIARALDARQVPVWMPSRMALAADIPASWDVTSDSLAAWLAGQLNARQLLLVKHVGLGGATVSPPEATVSSPELIARSIVDQAFAAFLKSAKVPAAVLGPADHTLLAEIIKRGSTAGTRIDA
jgi:5-(aminomethyl)-3-furanmethanol phosphate kinase